MLEITSVANVLGKQDMGVNEMAQAQRHLPTTMMTHEFNALDYVVDGKNKLQQPVH